MSSIGVELFTCINYSCSFLTIKLRAEGRMSRDGCSYPGNYRLLGG